MTADDEWFQMCARQAQYDERARDMRARQRTQDDAEYRAYCEQQERARYDDQARDALRAVLNQLGPTDVLRVVVDATSWQTVHKSLGELLPMPVEADAEPF